MRSKRKKKKKIKEEKQREIRQEAQLKRELIRSDSRITCIQGSLLTIDFPKSRFMTVTMKQEKR